VLPGTTYLVTRRCSQRQFLLLPTERTNGIVRYCLARAAERSGVQVHAFCVMSNHYHLVVTDLGTALPEFMRYLNEFLARALNAAHGRWENFWAPESYSAVRLVSPDDIVEKVAYALANPVVAGLVPRARRWPGLWSDPREVDGAPLVAFRPDGFFRPNGPTPARSELRLTRPPGWATADAFIAAVETALRRHEDTARVNVGIFLGVRGILRQHPTDTPSSVEPRRRLNPRVAAADRSARIGALAQLSAFLRAYRRAWQQFRAGVREVLFPAGTYRLRVQLRVACASP
jgi:REP element-mobilizing transposase RayT